MKKKPDQLGSRARSIHPNVGDVVPCVFVLFVLKVGETALTSRALMLNARKKEAEADSEGVGTEGSLSPGEVYSSERKWASEEFQRADAELKGEKKKKKKGRT